jgi:hexosaminidase
MPIDTLIPKPVKLTPMDGVFALTADTIIVASSAASTTGHTLAQALAPATGFWLNVTSSLTGANSILIELAPDLAHLGTEGYQLNVTPEKVALRAPQPAGLFYGVQSFLQLLPPEILRQAQVENVAWTVPCVQIEDYSRFGWRGAMLDVGRHFAPKAFVKKFIDLLAFHKLNIFHWHLTEDQGWRIEIQQYPRLTEIGAWRKETLIGKPDDHNPQNDQFDGKPHGGYYTQDDVREIVAYARARYINVMPEIEMPGHAQAAIAAYPELGNTGQHSEVGTTWGIYENVYNVEEGTLQFLQNVMAEVLALFPSPFIHIGGDECPQAQWKANPQAQARMKELGLKDEEGLQSYFVRRMDEFLTRQGRRLVGWDEILEGGLAPNATVMSWRGEAGGIAAARAGHDVVMSPNTSTYLDYYQSEDRSKEPLAIGGFVPLEKVYAYEPIPSALTPDEARHVLGAQAQLWTEYMPHTRDVEYMAFPRLCALAEAVWTPGAAKDYGDFTQRLQPHLKRLSILDVNYRPLDK